MKERKAMEKRGGWKSGKEEKKKAKREENNWNRREVRYYSMPTRQGYDKRRTEAYKGVRLGAPSSPDSRFSRLKW